MSSEKKGIILVAISSVIYGISPVLARFAYDEGTNSVTIAFLRSALALPFLFIIMKIRKIPFATSPVEIRDLLSAGIAVSATTILLYSSYVYIQIGEATTLFFIFPALVSLGCVLFYKEKLTNIILIALALSAAGVYMFSENLSLENIKSAGSTGFLLAIASGFTFAFYVVRVDKSSLRHIPAPKITFAVCVIAAICSGIYGKIWHTGGLAFGMSLKGWVYAWIIALSISLVAVIFFQLGVKYMGATRAAILATLEPIISVLCGALFLGERLSFPKIIGCACIIVSVIIITTAGSESGQSA